MQRSDLYPVKEQTISFLDTPIDTARDMIIAENNESLLMRLEKCINALSMQDELHNNLNKYPCATSMLLIMTPVIIEAIIILTTLSMSNTTVLSNHEQNSYNFNILYCPSLFDHYYHHCFITSCGDHYPVNNLNDPWPYAAPSENINSILNACYSLYSDIIGDAFVNRTLIIAATSCINAIISIALFIAMSTAPQRQGSYSEITTLAILPKKIQDEINDLATKTSTIITDSHNINEIIAALLPALEERRQARQRRAFLSGSLAQNENSPLYRFFHGQTVNDKYVRGDGDMATTERIFKYAGLLK